MTVGGGSSRITAAPNGPTSRSERPRPSGRVRPLARTTPSGRSPIARWRARSPRHPAAGRARGSAPAGRPEQDEARPAPRARAAQIDDADDRLARPEAGPPASASVRNGVAKATIGHDRPTTISSVPDEGPADARARSAGRAMARGGVMTSMAAMVAGAPARGQWPNRGKRSAGGTSDRSAPHRTAQSRCAAAPAVHAAARGRRPVGGAGTGPPYHCPPLRRQPSSRSGNRAPVPDRRHHRLRLIRRRPQPSRVAAPPSGRGAARGRRLGRASSRAPRRGRSGLRRRRPDAALRRVVSRPAPGRPTRRSPSRSRTATARGRPPTGCASGSAAPTHAMRKTERRRLEARGHVRAGPASCRPARTR